ncbi:thiolase-like protein [Mycena leptocephala]|nr:thiolase-like protein [Mycena leptocephala]
MPEVQVPTQGTFLKNATSFDDLAFGVSTRDARVTLYSARRLLDLAFQALQDSGIEPMAQTELCDGDGSFSFAPSATANRISYALDLTGPSVYLDTACASSLTAFHLAIGAIEKGDCSAALVGAAQVNRDTYEWESDSQAGVLAADGMSRPMDAAAAGFGRGEGAVVVVLKPLKDAVKENDHIYSVVLGSAINATGGRMPLNVPNGVRQQECIQEAYRRSGVSPDDTDYVELHGTGTPTGDPGFSDWLGRMACAA